MKKRRLIIIGSVLLALILSLSTFSVYKCLKDKQYNEIVNPAIEELKLGWENFYKEFPAENRNNTIYIKNTRIVELTKNQKIAEYKDIKYIIEFTIFSDYYCTNGKYLIDAGRYDNVLICNDGTVELIDSDIIKHYFSSTYDLSFSKYIARVIDLESSYNQKITLKI